MTEPKEPKVTSRIVVKFYDNGHVDCVLKDRPLTARQQVRLHRALTVAIRKRRYEHSREMKETMDVTV
jgi:hypothetical protein